MRDVYQLIREKELEIIRVRLEIEALRAVLPLLEDDSDPIPASTPAYSAPLAVNRD